MELLSVLLRGFQAFFVVVVLALSGALVGQQDIGGSPSEVNFALFTGIFALVSLFYFFFAAFSEGHGVILLALDGLNLLFTFASATALAAALGVHSCGNAAYIVSNRITNGSLDPRKRCHEGQALDAFLWFTFISFLITLGFSAMAARRGGASVSTRSRV